MASFFFTSLILYQNICLTVKQWVGQMIKKVKTDFQGSGLWRTFVDKKKKKNWLILDTDFSLYSRKPDWILLNSPKERKFSSAFIVEQADNDLHIKKQIDLRSSDT